MLKAAKKPSWIVNDVYKEMNSYWSTDYAQSRSSKASTSRLSERGGLGIHKHLSGQKSFLRVQRDLEEKYGKSVSIGEVFVKTHTHSDGSYVDLKAQQISETYDRNVSDMLSQIGGIEGEETCAPQELTTDQLNSIFIEASIPDKRGTPYGLGSLSQVCGTGSRGSLGSSSTTFGAVQKQLQVAQQIIEEQAAALQQEKENHEATQSTLVATKSDLAAVISWIQTRDPHFNQSIPNQAIPVDQPQGEATNNVTM